MSGLGASSPGAPGSGIPGWHPDPFGRCDLRWWDGAEWTEWGSRDGTRVVDHPQTAPSAAGAHSVSSALANRLETEVLADHAGREVAGRTENHPARVHGCATDEEPGDRSLAT